MSNDKVLTGRVVPFHQVEIGHDFQVALGSPVYKKINKIAGQDGDNFIRVNSQKYVIEYTGLLDEIPWQEIEDRHTTDFTERQRDDLIGEIVARAQRQYGADRINVDRLTKGLRCAHRAKPIRLIDLLNTCNVDFPEEILSGVYRHYQPETDTMRGGWTARHSEPYEPSLWDILFS